MYTEKSMESTEICHKHWEIPMLLTIENIFVPDASLCKKPEGHCDAEIRYIWCLNVWPLSPLNVWPLLYFSSFDLQHLFFSQFPCAAA